MCDLDREQDDELRQRLANEYMLDGRGMRCCPMDGDLEQPASFSQTMTLHASSRACRKRIERVAYDILPPAAFWENRREKPWNDTINKIIGAHGNICRIRFII